jgi:hypothetical protein
VTPKKQAQQLRAKYAAKYPGKGKKERKAIEFWVETGSGGTGLPEHFRRVTWCPMCSKLIVWKSVAAWMRAWMRGNKRLRCQECR